MIVDAILGVYSAFDHSLSASPFKKWFRDLYEKNGNEYEYFALYRVLIKAINKNRPNKFRVMSFKDFDRAWQYRLVRTPEGLANSKSEFINLCIGWF